MLMRTRARDGGLRPQSLLLGYSAVLAFTAGFVNAVALLILAFPVGNLTAVTTQLGMHTANPWLYESSVLGAILGGFLLGATITGIFIAPTKALAGPRHAIVLVLEAVFLLLAAAGVEASGLKEQMAALGIDETVMQTFCAAIALGLQNGLTSSFRGMAVRTTHFTGTVTDLGLMLGRVRQHGIDKWKATILTATLVLFLAGGTTGLLAGDRYRGYSLLLPAALCLVAAAASMLHGRHPVAQSDPGNSDDAAEPDSAEPATAHR